MPERRDNCAFQLEAEDRHWNGPDDWDDDDVPGIVIIGGWPEEEAS